MNVTPPLRDAKGHFIKVTVECDQCGGTGLKTPELHCTNCKATGKV